MEGDLKLLTRRARLGGSVKKDIRPWCNGSTSGSDPENRGSSPCGRTTADAVRRSASLIGDAHPRWLRHSKWRSASQVAAVAMAAVSMAAVSIAQFRFSIRVPCIITIFHHDE
jgi:hypothetical protein